jgi:hypothetical protein
MVFFVSSSSLQVQYSMKDTSTYFSTELVAFLAVLFVTVLGVQFSFSRSAGGGQFPIDYNRVL